MKYDSGVDSSSTLGHNGTRRRRCRAGWGMRRGIPLPSRLRGMGSVEGERRELPSGVWCRAPAEINLAHF